MISKKYIHLLFVVSLSLHSLPIMSAEFLYGTVPTQEVSEVSAGFSEILKDNPIIMPVVAGIAAATVLFCGRNKISTFTKNQCEACEQFLTKKHAEVASVIQQECETSVKKFQEASFSNRCLLSTLRCSLSGLNYIKHNQWYMGAAAIVFALGHVAGHAYIGAGLGGGVLIKGWNKQDFAEMHGRFDNTDRKVEAVRAENARLHAESNAKLVQIGSDVTSLSAELAATGIAIEKQMTGFEVKVSGDIKAVGENLTGLDSKLKNVPQQLLSMAAELQVAQKGLTGIQGSNAEIIQQNSAIIRQTDALSQQLRNATKEFVSTKKEFDGLGETLTAQVKQLAEDTQKQINTLHDFGGKQIGEMQELKSKMTEEFEELFERVAANNLLLGSFQTIQISQDQQLTQLLEKINHSDNCGKQTLSLVNELMMVQKQSAERYNKLAGHLDAIQIKSLESTNTTLDRIKSLKADLKAKIKATNEKVDSLSEKVEKNERERKENHEAVMIELKTNKEDLQQNFNEVNLRQENRYAEIDNKMDIAKKESDQKQLELYRLVNSLSTRLAEAEKRLTQKIDAAGETLRNMDKKIEENLDITKKNNSLLCVTDCAGGSFPYPLSVPIHPWGQEEQFGSRTFPNGKKFLPEPVVPRPPSRGLSGTNPK